MTDFHMPTPRNDNAIVNDEKEMRKLDVVCMKQPKKVREEVVKDYAERLFERHGLDTNVPDEFHGYKLPVHVLFVQAGLCVRPWSDVELLLNNLPPRLAEYTLMRSDGEVKRIPLHHAAAGQAPRSVIQRMLALAPDSIQVKFSTGWLPLHFAASYNNADAIVSLVNAYPDALLERDIRGKIPIDVAIDENRNEALNIMLPAAVDKVCDASFHNYGNLMDTSKYNGSSNPVNLVFLECINDKRSCDDVLDFIHQLEQYPIMFRSFVRHALMSNTKSSPCSYACKIRFNDNYSRGRVLNALKNAGDNTEGFASENVSSSLDDSLQEADLLGHQDDTVVTKNVIQVNETPNNSGTFSREQARGSGKLKATRVKGDGRKRGNLKGHQDDTVVTKNVIQVNETPNNSGTFSREQARGSGKLKATRVKGDGRKRGNLRQQKKSNTDVPDELHGYKSTVHVVSLQAGLRVRPWSDVDLLLINFPPSMARSELMRKDGESLMVPLHHVVTGQAPRSVIQRMLALAPDSIRIKTSIGWLPLHFATEYNNVHAIVSLVNAYPDALLERDIRGKTPIDVAIDENRNEALNIMLPAAVDKVCDASFHNYGNLMDTSKYNGSSNPVNLVFLECINDKRSSDDVLDFIHQLEQYPIMFRSFVRHALMSNTKSSPCSYACKIRFNDNYSRGRVLNALKNAGDNTEGFASENVSSSLGDSPRGSDRLSRRRLAEACTEVLKIVESPEISITCRIFRD